MRRRLRWMLWLAAGGALAVVTLNWAVDPFSLYGTGLVPAEHVKASRDDLYPGYAPAHAGRARVALIGTSRTRTGFWIPCVLRNGLLNAGIPGAGFAALEAAAAAVARRHDVELMVLEASFFLFLADFHPPHQPVLLRRLDGERLLRLQETLASRDALKMSCRKLLRWCGAGRTDDDRDVPWGPSHLETALEEEFARPALSEDRVRRSLAEYHASFHATAVAPERMARFEAIIQACQARGKEVVLLVPPVTDYRLELIRQSGLWDEYEAWKRHLATRAPTWDFGRYSRVSRRSSLFRDMHHFRSALGWLILRRVLAEREGREPAWHHDLDPIGVLLDPGRGGALPEPQSEPPTSRDDGGAREFVASVLAELRGGDVGGP